MCIVRQVQYGCLLTKSQQDVRDIVENILDCCLNSERISMLRQGLESWFTMHAVNLQLVNFYSYSIHNDFSGLQKLDAGRHVVLKMFPFLGSCWEWL